MICVYGVRTHHWCGPHLFEDGAGVPDPRDLAAYLFLYFLLGPIAELLVRVRESTFRKSLNFTSYNSQNVDTRRRRLWEAGTRRSGQGGIDAAYHLGHRGRGGESEFTVVERGRLHLEPARHLGHDQRADEADCRRELRVGVAGVG